MKFVSSFRYAIQHEDEPGKWRTSASADERSIIMRMMAPQNPDRWRVLDQETNEVIAGKGATT